ncbi:MAG: DUF4418 family protein, partial [Chloroflexi bacterium]
MSCLRIHRPACRPGRSLPSNLASLNKSTFLSARPCNRSGTMKKFGIGFIVLAAVIAIVPLLTQCQAFGKAIALANGKTVPMKCHWTAEAALASAIPLAIAGVLLLVNHRKETHMSLYIISGLLGAIVILLPTVLFGVCADQS